MTLSKTGFIYSVTLFYVILSVFMGFYGSLNDEITPNESVLTDNKLMSFLPNIIDGYNNIPTWLNVVLFGPLGIALLFVVITSLIPTANGGS